MRRKSERQWGNRSVLVQTASLQACTVSKQDSRRRRREGKKGDDWRRLVYHWRLVRSLVWDMGSNYYDPISSSWTDLLLLFYFLSPLVPKKDPAKAGERRVGGKNRGEKPEEETPLLDSITACAWGCMLKQPRLPSSARGISFHSHGVSTILEQGWGLPDHNHNYPR